MTGSTGFIGRHLVDSLEGIHNIIPLSRRDGIDLSTDEAYGQVETEIDCVVHLAANTSISDSFDRPKEFIEENLKLVRCAARFAKVNKVKLFLYTNTYPYGNPDYMPIDESHRLDAPTPYHESKILGEKYLLDCFKDSSTKLFIGRLFNVYGFNQRTEFLVSGILNQIKQTQKVAIRDLNPKRDFVYIDDVITLFQKVLTTDFQSPMICNVGSGVSFSVEELLDQIKALISTPFNIENMNNQTNNISINLNVQKF